MIVAKWSVEIYDSLIYGSYCKKEFENKMSYFISYWIYGEKKRWK